MRGGVGVWGGFVDPGGGTGVGGELGWGGPRQHEYVLFLSSSVQWLVTMTP